MVLQDRQLYGIKKKKKEKQQQFLLDHLITQKDIFYVPTMNTVPSPEMGGSRLILNMTNIHTLSKTDNDN